MEQTFLTSIVVKRNVTMLDIVSTRMLGQFGFLARVMFSLFAIFAIIFRMPQVPLYVDVLLFALHSCL